MISSEMIPAVIFIFIASITPGPNNIACASMGLVFGYKETLPFIGGILAGCFAVMFLCGSMSSIILSFLPSLSVWIRWAGCCYILWLAWLTCRASYSFGEEKGTLTRLGFTKGVILQFLNPKLMFYGITLFSAFLGSISGNMSLVFLWTGGLTIAAFFTLSLWTLFGTVIKLLITSTRLRTYINIFLSLLLVYTAVSLLLTKG
jgi:threonine/homoserine/homoserine lactone efflux protein